MNFQRCDDGSEGRRGFVSTPANDTDWPVCKYGKYIQPEFKPHNIEPFSSSYSLSCAASSPSWRSTTGHKNYIFQDLTFFVWRFHTLWCRRSPRRAVRWTTRRTHWSASRSRLAGSQLDDGMKLQHDFTFFLLSLDIFPQSIFVTAASYGKKKLSRELCNGQKDSAQVYTDCIFDATDEVFSNLAL